MRTNKLPLAFPPLEPINHPQRNIKSAVSVECFRFDEVTYLTFTDGSEIKQRKLDRYIESKGCQATPFVFMAFRIISLTYFATVLSLAFAMLNVNPFLRSAKQTVLSQMRLGSSIVPTLCTTPSAAINNGSFKDPQFSMKILEAHFPLAAYPTREDTQVIEQRQIMRTATSLFGVENSRCKHGFPQAYVQYPVGGGISSGMIRLSCPHLVKAVDEMESDGALNDFDAKLADEAEGLSLRISFNDTNLAWRSIRKSAVTMEDREYMDEKLGIEGTKFLMDSGIIGCTIGKLQVKCLHAHIGDHLMRGTNEIGKEALAKLETRGVDVKGCDNCWQQCNLRHTPTVDSWWYTSHKNKQKLVGKRISRVVHKKYIKLKQLRIESEAYLEATEGERLSNNTEEINEVKVEEKKMH